MKLGDWIGLLCFAIALVILWQFRQILLLIFTAIVLAIALNSFVRFLSRWNIPRPRALPLALVAVVVVAVLFGSLVMPPFLNQFQQLLQLVPEGIDQLITWANDFIDEPPAWFPARELDLQLELPGLADLTRQVTPVAQRILGNFFTFFSNSVTNLLQGLLTAVLTIMFAADPKSYRRAAIRLFPSFYRRRADEIFSACETALLSLMAGLCINSVFVATCSGIGLALLGIPFVLAHALLAGAFNLVPNIGPAASVVFPISVALVEDPWKVLVVVVLYVAIQNLESYWFSPMIMQKQVSLLPAFTLVAQIFFTTFLGLLGLILALPLAVVAKTWFDEAIVRDLLDTWEGSDRAQLRSTNPVLPRSPYASAGELAPAGPRLPEVDGQSEAVLPRDLDLPPGDRQETGRSADGEFG